MGISYGDLLWGYRYRITWPLSSRWCCTQGTDDIVNIFFYDAGAPARIDDSAIWVALLTSPADHGYCDWIDPTDMTVDRVEHD